MQRQKKSLRNQQLVRHRFLVRQEDKTKEDKKGEKNYVMWMGIHKWISQEPARRDRCLLKNKKEIR